jgi:NAD(P)-dependent dehydrogenase (short-subunit alcohol dehydrogenase family)
MPRIDLSGKPIAISGASSGIGAATALACARAGMPVALGARRIDKLDAIVARIRQGGGRAIAVQTDVTRPEDCRHLVDAAAAEFGSLYSVYANAGYGCEAAIADMADDQVRDMFETNFFGTLSLIRAALPHLLENPPPHRGHILICSSCVAKMALPYYGVYSATKAAQSHIGRAMNLELRPHCIHVSNIHPIGTRTEFFDQVKNRTGVATLVEHTPQGLLQSPDYVAAKTIACLQRPRSEVWTGPKGAFVRFGMSVCTLFPRIGDFALKNMIAKRMRNQDCETGSSRQPTPGPDRRAVTSSSDIQTRAAGFPAPPSRAEPLRTPSPSGSGRP